MASAVLLVSSAVDVGEGMDWTESHFGPDDQAVASNLMTAEKALEAITPSKSGESPGLPLAMY
ncbi:MAG: hypothetical protein KTR32_05750 [Granulosicoccus sp.]|nr:hypothetical protein [Granulosicoccus sp.]